MFVDVIVNIPNSNVDKVFEYHVPSELEDFIKIGSRIEIPFGESSRLITGFITNIHEEKLYEGNVKDISDIPELYSLINDEQFKIASYIKKYSICPTSRIFNSMIPTGLKGKTYKYLYTDSLLSLDSNLTNLFNGNNTLKLTKKILEDNSKLINKALKDKLVSIEYDVEYKNKQVYKDIYYKNIEIKDYSNYKIKESILNILNDIHYNIPFEKVDLREMGINDYYISKFLKLGIFNKNKVLKSRIIDRNFEFNREYYFNNSINESKEYYEIYNKSLKDTLWIPNSENTLIEGISLTILDNIKNNKNTLILVPDILSSYKISYLIKNFLGLPVITINSNIKDGESLDDYFEVLNNDYKIFVSTTVSFLWPYHDLGTIYIIDSESDNYLLEQSPRVNVLDIMKERSKYQHSRLVYVSYVPNIRLFSDSIMNNITLIDQMNYLGGLSYSNNVSVVDMKEELKNNNFSPISNELKNNIINTINNHKNVLLILNNKGYSDFVICRTCGHVEKCDKCNVSLKYVEKNNRLVCPSCGRFKEFNGICSSCGSKTIKFMGLGAEKLKEIIEKEIIGAKVKILSDAKYSSLKETIESLDEGDINIVISTDTYMRGLVNANISLIGVMSLDLIIKAPLYNADIKAYSMLFHSKLLGNYDYKMIIQSYNCDNSIIKNFINNDYFSFYKDSINKRNILLQDPFYIINRIFVKCVKYNNEIFDISKEIIKYLKSKFNNLIIYGPVYNYSYNASQILIKTNDFNNYELLLEEYNYIYEKYRSGNISIVFDNYPKSIS